MRRDGLDLPLYGEERHTLRCNERQSLFSLYRTETLSLLHREFSPQMIECPSVICRSGRPLLCTKERVSSLDKGERVPLSVPLLYAEGRVSLTYKGSRDSSRCTARCLICREKEYVFLPIGKRDALSFAMGRFPLLRL